MKLYIFILLLSTSVLSFGQGKAGNSKNQKKLDKQTILGIQVSPLIPSNFLEKNDYKYESDSVNYSINNQSSISYGVEIRHYFTYRFAINTGIIYTRRNIKVDYDSHYTYDNYYTRGTDTTFSRDLKFTAFEIPIKASGYVRLNKEIYMSIAGGINLNFYPSNIRVDNIYVQRIGTQIGSKAWQFFQLGVSASLGWEYRTKNSGIIYLGASYQAHFDDMASVLIFEEETIHKADFSKNIKGSYFSIDIKYFFPINEKSRKE